MRISYDMVFTYNVEETDGRHQFRRLIWIGPSFWMRSTNPSPSDCVWIVPGTVDPSED